MPSHDAVESEEKELSRGAKRKNHEAAPEQDWDKTF